MATEGAQPQFDALLIHGLGWRHSAEEEAELLERAQAEQPERNIASFRFSRPSLEGHFVDSAAQSLYRKGIVADNIVVTGAQLFDHPTPYAKVLENQFKIKSPEANVIDADNPETRARTTAMEINGLIRQAQKNGWENVATVTLGIHKKRAEMLARKVTKKTGIRIKVFAAEDVLTNPDMHDSGEHVSAQERATRYENFFKKLRKSKGYKKFTAHELIARNIERTHTTALFDKVSKVVRPKVMSK